MAKKSCAKLVISMGYPMPLPVPMPLQITAAVPIRSRYDPTFVYKKCKIIFFS